MRVRQRWLWMLSAVVCFVVIGFKANAQIYVGSYWVGGGTYWQNNPPCYTPQEAAALLFGGTPTEYAISIDPNTITYTGWEDGYGDTVHLKFDWAGSGGNGLEAPGTPVPENYKLQTGTGYNNPGGFGTAFSAYVADNDAAYATSHSQKSINYVWRIAPVPEPGDFAFLLAAGTPGLALLLKRRFLRIQKV